MKKAIDWQKLNFEYMPTDTHIRYVWRDGKWDEGQLYDDLYMPVHVAATAFHYGQSAFEGLKAFRCKDGVVRAFRPDMNAGRLADTARRICMQPVPESLFTEAVERVIKANLDYVPPYGTGGSLYIRPLLFGSGPRIGVRPSAEYTFVILVLPVGPYYKGGLKPVRAVVLDGYDRTAPHGLGNVKVAGNYAASLKPHEDAAREGFAVELYLDSREHKYIDEFGTSNFIAITRDGRYVTPKSDSILPSVTNRCLQQLATDMDIPVDVRPVPFSEVPEFAEIAACGTAVVITPVYEIVRGQTTYTVGADNGCGPILQKLYDRMTAIQFGEAPDPYGWTRPVA